jgi:uncharacterized protein (UPF0216 family)
MSKVITKYRLKSTFGYETEFEVTRVRVVETRIKATTDDEGYPISGRQKPKVEKIIRHGLEAISLPSRRPAEVEVLETKEMNETEELKYMAMQDVSSEKTDPLSQKEIEELNQSPSKRPISLTRILESKDPVVLPKLGIVWADDSNNRNDTQENEQRRF